LDCHRMERVVVASTQKLHHQERNDNGLTKKSGPNREKLWTWRLSFQWTRGFTELLPGGKKGPIREFFEGERVFRGSKGGTTKGGSGRWETSSHRSERPFSRRRVGQVMTTGVGLADQRRTASMRKPLPKGRV